MNISDNLLWIILDLYPKFNVNLSQRNYDIYIGFFLFFVKPDNLFVLLRTNDFPSYITWKPLYSDLVMINRFAWNPGIMSVSFRFTK